MKTYEIKTITTMKPYNAKKWWIGSDYIKPITVRASNPKEALKVYCSNIIDNNYIEISKTAMNKAAAMYRDTENGAHLWNKRFKLVNGIWYSWHNEEWQPFWTTPKTHRRGIT